MMFTLTVLYLGASVYQFDASIKFESKSECEAIGKIIQGYYPKGQVLYDCKEWK